MIISGVLDWIRTSVNKCHKLAPHPLGHEHHMYHLSLTSMEWELLNDLTFFIDQLLTRRLTNSGRLCFHHIYGRVPLMVDVNNQSPTGPGASVDFRMVPPAGFEPATSCLRDTSSNQLSYKGEQSFTIRFLQGILLTCFSEGGCRHSDFALSETI